MDPLQHMIALGTSFSAVAAASLFAAVWQGTVLAATVALCLRLLPRLSAAARSAVWIHVFALLVLFHVLPALSGHGALPAVSPKMVSRQIAVLRLDPRWSLGVALLWAALTLWKGAQLLLSAARLRRLAARATPLHPDDALRALLEENTPATGKARRTQLCSSDEVDRPCLVGFLRPRILLPEGLPEQLSASELQQIILHELEHLHRADNWSNLLQKLGLVLFPLNPALRWVERRLCAEREIACDDRVLRSGPGHKAYAACLARLAEYSLVQRGVSLVLGAWERQSELVRRVNRIVARPTAAMTGRAAALSTAGVVAGALGCALALSRAPEFLSFAPAPSTAPEARLLPISNFTPFAVQAPEAGPHLVKAVMPQRVALPSRRPHRPKPVAEQAAGLPEVARESPASQPGLAAESREWIVLTEWQAADASPQLVLAVDRGKRSSYAAIQTAEGWLILQI